MTGRVQSLRSNVAGNRPTGRQPGELYVNWPDKQLGVVDNTATAVDLLAVRFFSTTTSYNPGDYVVQGGKLYTAKGAVPPGVFNSTQWSLTGGNVAIGDTAPATPDVGALWFDTAGGQLYVWYNDGNTTQWVIATNAAKTDLSALVPLAGGTMTGPLILAADPTSSLGATTKQYADTKLAKLGVTDGSDAAAGQIGEVISSVVLSPGVTVTTGTVVNVTSIPLTAGDWDVQGEVWPTPSAGGATLQVGGIGPTSAALPPHGLGTSRTTLAISGMAGQALPLRPCRVSLSAPATYYLIAQVNFSSGTCTAYGNIWARRVR